MKQRQVDLLPGQDQLLAEIYVKVLVGLKPDQMNTRKMAGITIPNRMKIGSFLKN